VVAEKAEELFGLAATRAEMHVGYKKSTEFSCAVLERHRPYSRAFCNRLAL
jgi:hypothetical protein